MIQALKLAFGAIFGRIIDILGWYAVGRKSQERIDTIASKEASVKALKEREEIEDDVRDDTDLAARARRAGVLRGPGAED